MGVVIDVVKSLHGCDRELIFNVNSQLRSMEIPITSIWKATYTVTLHIGHAVIIRRELTLYIHCIITSIWKGNLHCMKAIL